MKKFTLTPMLAASLTALILMSCGKNMHVGMAPPPKTDNSQISNEAFFSSLSDEEQRELMSEKIHSWSKSEMVELAPKLPYLKSDRIDVPVVQFTGRNGIGKGNYSAGDKTNPTSYTKGSLVAMRGRSLVPPKEAITDIVGMRFILKGFRLWTSTGATTLAGQFICNMESMSCSGDDPVGAADSSFKKENANKNFWEKGQWINKNFSQLSVSKVKPVTFSDKSALMTTEVSKDADAETLEIDLLAALGLDKMTPAQRIDWVMTNSQPYKGTSFRTFHFVMGSSVWADAGYFSLQTTVNTDKLPKDFPLSTFDPTKVKKTIPDTSSAATTVADNSKTPPPADDASTTAANDDSSDADQGTGAGDGSDQ